MTVTSSALPQDRLAAIIGSGTMGAGIAQVAAAAGHPVILYDIRADAPHAAIESVRRNLQKLAAKGKLSVASAESAAARLRVATNLGELREAKIIIEAIAEDLHIKRGLFRELEGIVDADCIFATNTSSISINAIAASLSAPHRLAGMHFFNPAPLMDLVEIINGLATDPQLLKTIHATAAAWCKTPVCAKSTPGFIVNRVARPYYGEALLLLAEQAASPATIDALMREAGGFRMGPFELMDLVGLDIGLAVSQSLFNAYFADARYRPSFIQQEMVRARHLGKKTGRGFYQYGEDAQPPRPHTEPPLPRPQRVILQGTGPLAEALATRLASSGVAVIRETNRVGHEGYDEIDDAILAVSDGRSATQVAHEAGRRNCIVVDLALDYAKATRVGVTVASSCDQRAHVSAVGLLQAAGYGVSRIKDVPGMAVMRTVTMLANEAADAVNQGVATIADVDIAMHTGVNYPLGPLGWADALGLGAVQKVLTNLAAYYGGERYRVSPLIQHLVWAGKKFHDLETGEPHSVATMAANGYLL